MILGNVCLAKISILQIFRQDFTAVSTNRAVPNCRTHHSKHRRNEGFAVMLLTSLDSMANLGGLNSMTNISSLNSKENLDLSK